MDARTVQTRHRLSSAVLDLTRDRAPEAISVSELAAKAGINRATFYDHYASVTDLLVATLTHELDTIRIRSIAERGVTIPTHAHLPEVSIRRVADHVRAHRQMYEHALIGGGSPAVERALRQHFEASLLALEPPHQLPGDLPLAVAARYAAYGMVGAISAWLERSSGERLTREALVADIAAMQPAWWRG